MINKQKNEQNIISYLWAYWTDLDGHKNIQIKSEHRMELEDTRRKLREAMLVSGQQGALNERDNMKTNAINSRDTIMEWR